MKTKKIDPGQLGVEVHLPPWMKTVPYRHQDAALSLSWQRPNYALFLEQGLGKTKIVLDNASRLHQENKIDALFVIAPNGVHMNWATREIPQHMAVIHDPDRQIITWSAKSRETKWFKKKFESVIKSKAFVVFMMNVEALSMRRDSPAYQIADWFMRTKRCMMVVDESTRIKTTSSRRTKNIISLGRLAKYRRIMTGTPVTQSPFDLYSQFMFLDQSILGFTSYYSFRNQYGCFEKKIAMRNGKRWNYEELIRYIRLDELKARIDPHSFRRTKAECLDLPEKIYQRVPLSMTDEQSKLYNKMEEEGEIKIPDEGFELLAPLQITRLLRCQQILGGFLPTIKSADEFDKKRGLGRQVDWIRIKGKNPKLDFLMDAITDDYPGKIIVWARFRAEIEMIVEQIRMVLGRNSVVQLHGGITASDRDAAIDMFQRDPKVRVLVGQQQSGIGITLTAAETVFYYSNTFSYEQRYQSEDRTHRIGLKKPVLYVDLEMAGTVDEDIRDTLERARETADLITGDSGRVR